MAAAPDAPRPKVMLMTGLPLVWGERGPFDPASRPQASYSRLREWFDFQPVDVLDRATLARGRILFLAQPNRLAPRELAALDGWVRGGGRALILTDPMLTWPSELPLGDIRRPPPVGLLGPLLGHWRLTLEPPARPGEVEAEWNGSRILLDSPGRLRSSGPQCVVGAESWTARCLIGRGMVRIVADADLMRDSPTAASSSGNPAAVRAWLDEVAGTRRPGPGGRTGIPGAAGLALLVAAAGIAVLLHRRRNG